MKKSTIKEKVMDSLTVNQLEAALAYLYNPIPTSIPENLLHLTETQWLAVEQVASQLQEEMTYVTFH
jgi:hypothetical protein